jgi:hypothetical protein
MSLYDEKLFNDFIIPTILYFINFCYFEIRLVFVIWKSHTAQDENTNTFVLRNRFLKFYVIFCKLFINLDVMIILCFVFVSDLFFMKAFSIAIVSTTWLPQIYYNLRTRQRSRIYLSTVFIITINKLFVPVNFLINKSYIFECVRITSSKWSLMKFLV